MAYAKQHELYGQEFTMENLSINAFDTISLSNEEIFDKYFSKLKVNDYDTIAISAYVWNEHLINALITYLRKTGFTNKIVLGGYQITYGASDQLVKEYPECDIFISGYAEAALVEAILDEKPKERKFIKGQIDFKELPSPYVTGELEIPIDQPMIRLETKRGCPYRCSFCAHRDLTNNKVHIGQIDKVVQELKLFKERRVKRVNVLDPIFNVGKDYLNILKAIDQLAFTQTEFTFQTRFELIKGKKRDEFLSLAEKTNSTLEFGLQTVIPEEYKVINRPNNRDHIAELFQELNQRNINYEVSLIYGLPNQTVKSFNESIEFLTKNGCSSITAFPLMLLKGTELYDQKLKWHMQEEIQGDFNIPEVTSSNTFTKSEWLEMQKIASSLQINNRV
jgi:radical SAM superfamily enzyme YgiQ (UPF0313 family)